MRNKLHSSKNNIFKACRIFKIKNIYRKLISYNNRFCKIRPREVYKTSKTFNRIIIIKLRFFSHSNLCNSYTNKKTLIKIFKKIVILMIRNKYWQSKDILYSKIMNRFLQKSKLQLWILNLLFKNIKMNYKIIQILFLAGIVHNKEQTLMVQPWDLMQMWVKDLVDLMVHIHFIENKLVLLIHKWLDQELKEKLRC